MRSNHIRREKRAREYTTACAWGGCAEVVNPPACRAQEAVVPVAGSGGGGATRLGE